MNTIANLKPFDKIHLVRKFTGITHTQKIILLVIATHLGSNNSCYVSISTLLSECCLSKRDAITINIKKLIDLGVLFKISPCLGFKSNQYGINFDLLVTLGDQTSHPRLLVQSPRVTSLVTVGDPKRNLNNKLNKTKDKIVFHDPKKTKQKTPELQQEIDLVKKILKAKIR